MSTPIAGTEDVVEMGAAMIGGGTAGQGSHGIGFASRGLAAAFVGITWHVVSSWADYSTYVRLEEDIHLVPISDGGREMGISNYEF